MRVQHSVRAAGHPRAADEHVDRTADKTVAEADAGQLIGTRRGQRGGSSGTWLLTVSI